MTSFQKNIFLPISKPKNATGIETLYLDELIEKLLLFDKLIVRSVRLSEVSYLINHFGLNPTINLLKSQSISWHNDILKIGSYDIGNAEMIGKCRFQILTVDRQNHMKVCLQQIKKNTELSRSKFNELENYLVPLVKTYDDDRLAQHFIQFDNDIMMNKNTVKKSISDRIRKKGYLMYTIHFV